MSAREPIGAPGPRWGDPAAEAWIAARAPTPATPSPEAHAARRKATFGRRTAAALVDTIVVAVLVVVLAAVLVPAFGIDPEAVDAGETEAEEDFVALQLTLLVAVTAYFWTLNAVGWSPGKQALGLRVVRADGEPPGLGAGFARTVCWVLSLAPLGAGFLWVYFDSDGQAFHDKIAGTYVIHEERPP